MFAWIWSCMVISFKAGLGVIFWSVLLASIPVIITLILFVIDNHQNKKPLKREEKKPEDFDKWWAEQEKERDKWGNA